MATGTFKVTGEVFTNNESGQIVVVGQLLHNQADFDAMDAFQIENGFTEDVNANWAIIETWSSEERKSKIGTAIDLLWTIVGLNGFVPYNFGTALKNTLDYSDDIQVKEIVDQLFFGNTKNA